MDAPPEGHPPIDWNKWAPPGEGDVRSPCPMINALANHSVLPHSGKGISKEMAVTALTSAINLDKSIASVFASKAVTANPDSVAHAFDLNHVDKHGVIEHDASLSRDDAAFGDAHSFDKAIFEGWLKEFGGQERMSFESASRARYNRVVESKKKHEAAGKEMQYGIKEFIMSYGETALLMGVLGDPKDGKIPLEYVKVLFEEERLPYKEGWRPSPEVINQSIMNHLIFNLIKTNEHKGAEAAEVGLGTIHAVFNAVTSLLPEFCTVM